MFRPRARTAALLVAGAVGLAACGTGSPTSASSAGDAVAVVASFYPLQFAAERVGGDQVAVTNLTKAGAEPHDLELTPRDVARVAKADLVLYLSGFQPAVDDAVDGQARDAALDVADAARLVPPTADDDHDHADEGADEDDGDALDPHFWLDPTRLADVADAIAERLGRERPDRASEFTANAAALRTDLQALDAELQQGLSTCTSTDLVTSHAAFGYLAERYGLEQVGIAGLSPDTEPQPADLARVAGFVAEHGVRTIYYETLVSPTIAETVAQETGAATAVLDPLEGLSEKSAGSNYLDVMRANLSTLRAGQPCP